MMMMTIKCDHVCNTAGLRVVSAYHKVQQCSVVAEQLVKVASWLRGRRLKVVDVVHSIVDLAPHLARSSVRTSMSTRRRHRIQIWPFVQRADS